MVTIPSRHQWSRHRVLRTHQGIWRRPGNEQIPEAGHREIQDLPDGNNAANFEFFPAFLGLLQKHPFSGDDVRILR